MTRTYALIAGLLFAAGLSAQNKITAVLSDSSNGEPVPFATVSVSKEGAKKPDYYDLSTENGEVLIKKVRNGSYIFRVELLGYKTW